MVRFKLTNQASREGWEFSTGHSECLRQPRIISCDPFVVMKRHGSVEEVWQRCCGLPGGQHLIETSLTDMDLEAQGLVPNKPLTMQKSQSLIQAPSLLSLCWSYRLWIRWAKCSVLAILFTPSISRQCREQKPMSFGHTAPRKKKEKEKEKKKKMPHIFALSFISNIWPTNQKDKLPKKVGIRCVPSLS